MKKHLFVYIVILLLSVGHQVKAQYYADIQGRPMREFKADDAEGSPYLIDYWAPGSATTDKQTYTNMKLKYDLKNDALIFAGKDDIPMYFNDAVRKFTINSLNFASGFPVIDKQTPASYYQVLSYGKITLLKHQAKYIQETKGYGAQVPTREYMATTGYYFFKDNKISSIKPDRKKILEIMNDQAALIDTYLKTNKVNLKSDTELGKIFDYYNTL